MPLSESADAAKRKSVDPTGRRESNPTPQQKVPHLRSPKSPGLPLQNQGAPRSPMGRLSIGGDGRRKGSGEDQVLSESGYRPRRSVGPLNAPQGMGRSSPTANQPGSPGLSGSPRTRRVSMKRRNDNEDGEQDNNVKVFLRVRPFNQREINIHEEHSDHMLRSIIDMPDGPRGQVHFLEKMETEDNDVEYNTQEIFDFDRCLWSIYEDQQPYDHEFCSQYTLFEQMGAPALENAWSGFNTCIFAYGQTGAGKTHTMMGHFSYAGGTIEGDPGVIPLLCRALYNEIEEKKKDPKGVTKVEYETELCAYEIYNERVRDLFFMHTPGRKPKDELKVRKHPLDGPFVDGISRLRPTSWQDCIENIELGNSHRTTGSTAMNSESSRSHSVFQIKFTQVETSIPTERYEKPIVNRKYSVINLIDLAGSERNKKSHAAGERLVEAANINLSLTTLKRVIDALVYNSNNRNAPKQVPYRDSVLTMLLSHSLGGNSKTMMVACVSPHYDNSEETLNTLRYASQARRIVNVVHVNEDSRAKQNLLLKEQLANLQEELENRRGGDFSPKQLEELEDEIRAGQEALQAHEEEARRLRQEKEDEVEKRYQQAFQHSFQMVVMRKQKEKAQKMAAEAEADRHRHQQMELEKEETENQLALMKREASNLRRVHEAAKSKEVDLMNEIESSKQTRDQILTKAYGLQWVEKARRIQAERNATKSLKTAEEMHRSEMDAVVEAAAKEYTELQKTLKGKEEELEQVRTEVEAMKNMTTKAMEDSQTSEARVGEYRDRYRKLELETAENEREVAHKHKLELDTVRSKMSVEIQGLRRELDDRIARMRSQEEIMRKDGEKMREDLESSMKLELSTRIEAKDRKLRGELEAHHNEMAELKRETLEEMKKQRDTHAKEMQAMKNHYIEKLEEYKAKIDDQISVLHEVARREIKYRDLSHQLESAIERTGDQSERAGISPDLKEFLDVVRSYQTQLSSFPINRAAVARAAMPVSAFVSGAPPCVGGYEDSPWVEGNASGGGAAGQTQPTSATKGRVTSRSPLRKRRLTKGSNSASPGHRSGVGSPQSPRK